jgi:hypothetical protein
MQQLPHRDPQDGPVHGGQSVQCPALQMRRDQIVDMRRVLGDAASHRRRVGIQLRDIGIRLCQRGTRLGGLGRSHPAGLGFEQQVDGSLASLMPSLYGPAHALTRPK